MKKIALIIAVILFLLMFFTVRMEAQDTAIKEAITQAALDYMDGAHSGDAARLPEDKRNIEVTVLDVAEDLAMVKVLSARYYDFLQMAKVDGQWKILNVLWVMNPAVRR